VCDSYYLALDRELLSDREDAGKVRAVLRRLLEQWLAAVVTAAKIGTMAGGRGDLAAREWPYHCG
jgi:hypothetical protein